MIFGIWNEIGLHRLYKTRIRETEMLKIYSKYFRMVLQTWKAAVQSRYSPIGINKGDNNSLHDGTLYNFVRAFALRQISVCKVILNSWNTSILCFCRVAFVEIVYKSDKWCENDSKPRSESSLLLWLLHLKVIEYGSFEALKQCHGKVRS